MGVFFNSREIVNHYSLNTSLIHFDESLILLFILFVWDTFLLNNIYLLQTIMFLHHEQISCFFLYTTCCLI